MKSKKRKGQARMNGRAVTVRLSDVQAKQARWLWPCYIPLGKLTLLDGDADKGKSLLTLDLAARMTTGRAFQDGASCEAGGAVILSTEDDLEDTIRPRLDAAGADPSRVVCLAGVRASGRKGVSGSACDLDALEEAVTNPTQFPAGFILVRIQEGRCSLFAATAALSRSRRGLPRCRRESSP